jgi:Skp family chaperone for outer membrane proteins
MPKFKATSVVVAIFLAMFFICSVQKVQAQDNKIAVFYLQKVLEDSKKGKETFKKLDSKLETLNKSFETKAKDMDKKIEDLKKAKPTLSEDAFVKRSNELAQEYRSNMEDSQKAGVDFEKTREEAMIPLMKKVTDVVGGIAQERGYQFVFEVQNAGIFYHPQATDITADVIKGVDK